LAAQQNGFPGAGFQDLFELEAGTFWFRSRNKLIFWVMRKYFADARNFLEIGCGTGSVLTGMEREFPNLSLSGSELQTSGLLHVARRLRNVAISQMDARMVPFVSEFDVVGCFDVLEHTAEDTVVLTQIFKALRLSGGAMLTVPPHQFLRGQDDEYAQHARRYRLIKLKEKLMSAGFRLLHLTSFVLLLLPLMMASHCWKRLASAPYDPTSEFRIGRPVNQALERVLDVERTMISCGISFPFGGSLLALAQKPHAAD